ncbi:MAG TPA: hypothetical protein DEV64_01545 [Rhodospirillaceae bacterium]|nr:hypothetical protein [Rhodospirillaceae bacterium]|tara:strand:+ start:6988 stop:7167 length:180 start_codon:yes stop_codon:yes gene_type:complete
MSETAPRRFPAAELEDFISRALTNVGLPARDATDCGRLMVASDLAGFHTHGIFRLTQYM